MKNEPLGIIPLVSEVLGHQALGLGSSTITPLWNPNEAREAGIYGFQMHASGLAGSLIEDILLLNGNQIDQLASKIRTHVDASEANRFLIVCDPTQVGSLKHFGERVEVLSFLQLFRRLCDIPENLPALVLRKARHDFNHSKFRKRSQNRHLRVIHPPDIELALTQEVVPAREYFRNWARADTKRRPILLLGERGSGKTWQLFHFCKDIFDLHRSDPWVYGPPLFFDLREEGVRLGAFGTSVPIFPDAVLREYPNARFLRDTKLVESLISTGHMPICIDGFEEVSRIVEGDEGDAVDFLQRVCSTLSMGASFIVACRATHFGSMDTLLRAEVWPGTTVANAFEIVNLLPFPDESVQSYLIATAEEMETASASQRLEKVLQEPTVSGLTREAHCEKALREAVHICSKHPALLAAMVDEAARSSANFRPTDLLTAALIGAVVDYNIEMDKTTDIYTRPNGEMVLIGTKERVEVLGELVWHLAARGRDLVDMANIPSLFARYYGLDLKAIRTDIRTHTLLEVVPLETQDGRGQNPTALASAGSNLESSVLLRFAYRATQQKQLEFFPNDDVEAIKAADPYQKVAEETDRAKSIMAVAASSAPAGTTSVSGAYLLAKQIRTMLEQTAHVPFPIDDGISMHAVDRLAPVGQVPLGLAAAGILRDLLRDVHLGQAGRGARALADSVRTRIIECAVRGDFSVFSASCRYLGHNLEAMGLLSYSERAQIDPWCCPEVNEIVRAPSRLPQYKMVLVPPPAKDTFPSDLQQEGCANKAPGLGRPFLIGVTEVTNEDYLEFIKSEEGQDWRVENMTIAGGKQPDNLSRFAEFANEYYLYFWEEIAPGRSPSYLPLDIQLRHPVIYVSWYACAAFCNWMTQAEYQGEPVYSFGASTTKTSPSDQSTFQAGYRLPAVREWSWTARGGRLDITYPWELYPLCLSQGDFDKWRGSEGLTPAARESLKWLDKWRSVYRDIQLTMPKEHVPVLSDPFGPLGASGMMGNVKEWCHDLCGQNLDGRAILGATSFLGDRSFSFNYGISLFPQNTNPDVGFRVCRPLSDDEIAVLTHCEARIASLQPTI